MGVYLNPGNEEFRMNRERKYVDKSELIVFMNDRVNTSEQLISFSRPRRFGKSYAAQMLCAYYDAGCDSSSLFDDLIIANADEDKQNKNAIVQTGTLYAQMKQWYDGYVLDGAGSVYNPNSVMKALKHCKFKSYWQKTASSEALLDYIGLDYAGLSKTIAGLIGGGSVKINADRFQNDIVSFRSQDDVLTLLVHFGYLTYNEEEGTVNIPNEEILREFADAVKEVELPETVRRVKDSRQLLEDIVMFKEDQVAEHIERIHDEETNPLYYNREEDLRSTIRLAMFCYRDYYIRFEELPAGKGYADLVYLPKKRSNYPALVMELKWNEDSEGAISQIKDRNYPASIKDYGGEILLVGISYDKEASGASKKHNCRIEKFVK